MKSLLLGCLFLILLVSMASAEQVKTTLVQQGDSSAMQTNFSNGLSLGYVKEGTREVGLLTWRPDFRWGYFSMGFDLNVPLGQARPSNYEQLVFRYVEYDDTLRGLRYGVLNNVTLGAGLLMDNYSTVGNSVSALLNSHQMGLKGYYTFKNVYGLENIRILGMRTYSNLYAVRVSEKVLPWLTIGQSYVWDTDGISVVQTGGTTRNYPAESGYSIDAMIPIIWDMQYYAELAKITNYGAGAATGVKWERDWGLAAFTFNVGLRYAEANFVPGYFNAEYETDPIDIASVEATSTARGGYFLGLGGTVLGRVGGSVGLEGYANTTGNFNADAWVQVPQLGDFDGDIYISGYYKQPAFTNFRSLTLEEGSIAGGKVSYKINPSTAIVTHYKRLYNKDTGQVEDSQYYEVQLAF